MAFPAKLSDSAPEYQKREQRSLVMGVPRYADQCDSAESVTGIPGGDRGVVLRGPAARLEVYNGGSPEDYLPDVGFMDIPGADYEPYEVSFDQALLPGPQGIRDLQPDFDKPEVHYSDCPMTHGLFEHLMKTEGLDLTGRLDLEPIAEAPVAPGPMPVASDLEEIARGAAPLGELAPQVSFPLPSIDASSQYDHFDQLPASDLPPAPVDYAAIDPQDCFEQQRKILDNRFDQLETMPLDRGTPIEAAFLDQVVLFDPSQHVPLSPEPHMPRHMGSEFGPDVPPAP